MSRPIPTPGRSSNSLWPIDRLWISKLLNIEKNKVSASPLCLCAYVNLCLCASSYLSRPYLTVPTKARDFSPFILGYLACWNAASITFVVFSFTARRMQRHQHEGKDAVRRMQSVSALMWQRQRVRVYRSRRMSQKTVEMSNFSYYKIGGKLPIKLMALCSFTKGTAVQYIFLRYSVSIFVSSLLATYLLVCITNLNKWIKSTNISLTPSFSVSLIKVSRSPHF